MIFHIHHHHDENTCPANSPEAVGATFGSVLPALNDHGVTVIGAWVDPPGHDFFFVVETDSYDDLVEEVTSLYPVENEKDRTLSRGTALVLIAIAPPPNSPANSGE